MLLSSCIWVNICWFIFHECWLSLQCEDAMDRYYPQMQCWLFVLVQAIISLNLFIRASYILHITILFLCFLLFPFFLWRWHAGRVGDMAWVAFDCVFKPGYNFFLYVSVILSNTLSSKPLYDSFWALANTCLDMLFSFSFRLSSVF